MISVPHTAPLASALAAFELAKPTRQWLLQRARTAIENHLDNQRQIAPELPPLGAEALRGCFVSLHGAGGDLRGCIGTFEADAPLWRHVEDMAVAAATRDPRFVPLELADLLGCLIDISALTPRRSVDAQHVV